MVGAVGSGYGLVPRVQCTKNHPWQASDTIAPVIVQLSDNRRRGAQLQRRVINVGGGGTDGFEEFGYEVEIIPGSAQELIVLCNLIRDTSVSGDTIKYTKTDLLQPGHQIFQGDNGSTHSTKDTDHLQPCQEFLLEENT